MEEQNITPPAPPPSELGPAVPRNSRNNGCLWIFGTLFICGLIAGITILLPVLLGMTTINGLFGGIQAGIQNILNPSPAVATITTSQTIVQSVLPLGQLVSVSSQVAKADIVIGVQEGTLNACGHSANHVAVGSVEAGVDLTQMEDADIQFDEARDTYVVTLPSPQLTSCRIEFIRQYEQSVTTCGVDWDEIRILANGIALQEFRDDVIEGGILDRAEREASITLQAFVRALTGKNVEIHFAETGAPVYPASCEPQFPQGWVQDATTGQWSRP